MRWSEQIFVPVLPRMKDIRFQDSRTEVSRNLLSQMALEREVNLPTRKMKVVPIVFILTGDTRITIVIC